MMAEEALRHQQKGFEIDACNYQQKMETINVLERRAHEAQTQAERDHQNQALRRAALEAQHALRQLTASEVCEQQAVTLATEAESKEANARIMLEALQKQNESLRNDNSSLLNTIYQLQREHETKIGDLKVHAEATFKRSEDEKQHLFEKYQPSHQHIADLEMKLNSNMREGSKTTTSLEKEVRDLRAQIQQISKENENLLFIKVEQHAMVIELQEKLE